MVNLLAWDLFIEAKKDFDANDNSKFRVIG